MEKIDLNEYLASNEYPGRGIAVAKAPDGRQMFIGYFIMGRSENSRNRVFDPVPERGGICTMAADPAKLEDPSLIIYNPVLTLGRTHIVTNGDQTDTIYDLMSQGKSFADALRTRTFEPDGPNYTPRISAVVYADGSYQMPTATGTACSAISLITPSPWPERATSSAPTSTTAAPSPALRASRCALPAPAPSATLPTACGAA